MGTDGNGKLALAGEREERIERALNYEPLDRIPFTFIGVGYAPVSQGVTLAEFCMNPETGFEVTMSCLDELGGVDGVNLMYMGLVTPALSGLWMSKIDVPGIDLPENSLWQVHETEDMTADEYDVILEEGWPAYLERFMPRVQNLELLQRSMGWGAENLVRMPDRHRERGYAILCSGAGTIPFEALSGARSMQRFYLDCYRMPDKVKAVLDAMQPHFVERALMGPRATGISRIWVGGWRAASALVSPKIWNTLVWPYYVDMITKLHEQGIVSLLHFDQSWDRDLERFLELPRRSFICAFDGLTDVRRAKRILGDHCAFLGDVPSNLLASGTPDQVTAYVRDLIRDLGPTGLVMNPGCDTPFNAKPGNVRAMVEATHQYGALA